MIKLESTAATQRIYKVLIEEDVAVGFYVFVYETSESKSPERDYLQDSLEMAKSFCVEDLGVPLSSWKPVEGWLDRSI